MVTDTLDEDGIQLVETQIVERWIRVQEHELKFILESYSWKKSDTDLHLLQHVENDC